jgi:hypothetical protein
MGAADVYSILIYHNILGLDIGYTHRLIMCVGEHKAKKGIFTMKLARENTRAGSHYSFRGIRFRISEEELPHAVRQVRRFHARLVDQLARSAQEHAKRLASRRTF